MVALILEPLPAAAAADPRAIVEAVLSRSSHLKALRHAAAAVRADARTGTVWEGPRVSVSPGVHDSADGRGHILAFGLSQRLPLSGRKAEEARVLEARAEAADWEARAETLDLEHDTWLDLYRLAALGKAKGHLSDRRRRMGLVKGFLTSRPILSPAAIAERNLIEVRLRELESEFDRVETGETALTRKLELLSGLALGAGTALVWFDQPPPSGAPAPAQPPSLRRAESAAKAAESSLEATRRAGRLDPLLGAGVSKESAGTRERSASLALEADIPLAAWSGRPAAAAAEALSAARAWTEDARLDAALDDALWRAALEERRRRLGRLPMSLVETVDAQVDGAEAELRRALVPVMTFLELESRGHEQIEGVYQARIDFLEAVSRLRRLRGLGFALSEEAP
ncbi:MAG: hypothetical protein HY928_07825 [Elusimicrobia bacterium]|nr:hypothetical protein [Elusimicrobiota bacterium]